MATGTVKWFNETKGYGFIQPSEGGKDVFVHRTALPMGTKALLEGDKIDYNIITQRGKKCAADVRFVA